MAMTLLSQQEIERRIAGSQWSREGDAIAREWTLGDFAGAPSSPRVARFCHVPIRAIYGGPSHYRPFRDTWIISWGAVYYKVFEMD